MKKARGVTGWQTAIKTNFTHRHSSSFSELDKLEYPTHLLSPIFFKIPSKRQVGSTHRQPSTCSVARLLSPRDENRLTCKQLDLE